MSEPTRPAGTILIVEDNPITRKMLRVALQAEEYAVLEAENGAQALRLMDLSRPDLVVQDLKLPDIDGIELVRQLRRMEGGEEIPILALSGFLDGLKEAQRSGAGFTDYLYKPVEPFRLAELIRLHLHAEPEEALSGVGRHILVVDDQPLQLKLARTLLEQVGYQVDTAGSGAEALEKARLSPPDAILSDVLMPGMDGFRLCQAARGEPGLNSVPVVLHSSGYTEAEDALLARKLGAYALVPRDPELRQVLEVLSAALAAGGHAVELPPGCADREHLDRVLVQLERIAAMRNELAEGLALCETQLALLAALSELSPGAIELSQGLDLLVRQCADSLGLRYAAVILEENGTLRVCWSSGFTPEALEGLSLEPGSHGALKRCQQERETLLISTDELGSAFPGMVDGGHLLMIPLRAGAQCLGVLVFACPRFGLDSTKHANCLAFGAVLGNLVGQSLQASVASQKREADEARFGHLLAVSPVVTYQLAPDLTPLWTSPNLQSLFGYDPGEIDGHAWWLERVHPEDLPVVLDDAASRAGEDERRMEYRFRNADGSYRWVSDQHRMLLDDAGAVREIVGAWLDIHDRKLAEEEKCEAEQRYHTLFDQSPQPKWVLHPETLRFLEVNEAAVAHYGYTREEFRDLHAVDLVDPEFRAAMLGRVESGTTGRVGHSRHRRKDGTPIDVDIHTRLIQLGARSALLVIAEDITEQRRLEEKFQQAQKMEAVGRLAGGVAHDFNNMLSVINGYSELMLMSHETDPQLGASLNAILDAGRRAAGLTKQLLAFSRQQIIQPKVLDLNEVVGGTEKILRRLIGEDIELSTRLAPDLGRIHADAGQLDQVLMNLAVNARDAMPTGGRLTIETRNVELDASYACLHPALEAGSYVLLSISDDGCGMDAATRARVFEPFFTTKDQGQGTGLGLATVHGIVTQNGGQIAVYSEVGYGTTFKVYLPRLDAGFSAADPEAERVPLRGHETILLVEDEPLVRALGAEILRASGYTVLEAENGEAALHVCTERPCAPDLVLTDVVMPKMSGRVLKERLLALYPGVPVLFMSGYTDDAVVRHGILEQEVTFLHKPFTPAELTRKIRQMLDSQPGFATPGSAAS